MPNEKINGYNIAKPLVLAYYDKTYATLPSIDAKYGPYDSVEDCLRIIDSPLRAEGLTVAIKNSENKYDEYWFVGGIQDSNLELKVKNGQASKLEVIIVDFSTLQEKVDELSDKLAEFNPTGVELSEEQKRAIIERIMEAINTDNAVNAQTLVDEIQNTTKSYIEQLIREGRLTSGSGTTTTSGVTEDKVTEIVTKFVTNSIKTKIVTADTIADAINALAEKGNSDATKIKATKGIIKSITDIVNMDNVSYRAEVEAFITALYEKMKSKLPASTGSSGSSSTSATIDNTSFLNAFKDASFATNVLPYLIDAISSNTDVKNKLVELISKVMGATPESSIDENGVMNLIKKIVSMSNNEDSEAEVQIKSSIEDLFDQHTIAAVRRFDYANKLIKIVIEDNSKTINLIDVFKSLNGNNHIGAGLGIKNDTLMVIKVGVGNATSGAGVQEVVPFISFVTRTESITIDFADSDSGALKFSYAEYDTSKSIIKSEKSYLFSWSNILESLGGGSTTTVASNGTKVYATDIIRGINEVVNGIVFDFNPLVKFTSTSKYVIQGTLRLKDTEKGDGIGVFSFYWSSDYTILPIPVIWKNDLSTQATIEVIELNQSAIPGKLTIQVPYDPEIMLVQGITVTEITT